MQDIPFFPPSTRRRRRDEDQIQRAVFEHLRKRALPGVFAFHPANGGKRTYLEGAKFKAMGVIAGVPDVIAIKDGQTYALELKTDFGKVSDVQLATMVAMQAAGAIVATAFGLDTAIEKLESWGLIRGSAAHSYLTEQVRRAAG